MSLAELQLRIRDAVVDGTDLPAAWLTGGLDPARRVAIHRRHYEASLSAAIVNRFQATRWLIGAERLDAAARDFVHAHPPTEPCMAEYGRRFPAFLGVWPATSTLAYVTVFATLDWQLGRLSVCVDRPALGPEALASVGLDRLPDARVTLQEGLYLGRSSWEIDELIKLYLADLSPDAWHLRADDLRLQVRGTRGHLWFARLDPGPLEFREAVASGSTLAEAAERGLASDATFEPAAALMALVREGLITHIAVDQEGTRS